MISWFQAFAFTCNVHRYTAAGHEVTLLYTQGTLSHAGEGKDFEHWRAHYAVGLYKSNAA